MCHVGHCSTEEIIRDSDNGYCTSEESEIICTVQCLRLPLSLSASQPQADLNKLVYYSEQCCIMAMHSVV